MRVFRHFRDYDLVPILSMVLVCAFPCIFLYARNAAEAEPSGMLPFLLVFGLNSLLILLLVMPFFLNMSRAAFFTDCVMLVIINFTLIADTVEKLFPWLWSRYLLILFCVLLFALFLLLLLKKPDLRIGCILISIAFTAIIVLNTAFAIPDIYRSLHITKPDAEPDADTGITFADASVNVYYFIFDEYGGYENLLNYFDYDNSLFFTELEDRGFNTARESRNTEAVSSDVLCPNLLNLGYVMDAEDSGILTKYYLNNSYMVRMFSQNGYQINLINHQNYIGTSGCNVLTTEQTSSAISDYLLRNSLYWKIDVVRERLNELFAINSNAYTNLDNALQCGLDCWKYTKATPTLTIGYFGIPHSPLIIGRNGNHYLSEDGYNWKDSGLYLGQLEFTSDYILRLADTIQRNDPDALIIFQSDHGCRMPIHKIQVSEADDYDPQTENIYMQNILNCVYYKGESFEIEGQTGINTLRLVFSQVLGAQLDLIEPIYNNSSVSDSITPFQ